MKPDKNITHSDCNNIKLYKNEIQNKEKLFRD